MRVAFRAAERLLQGLSAASPSGFSIQAQTAPLHFCIVGTGPAGFYTADRLLKRLGQQVRVDLVDRLPTPFGLVRSGVAPDHQATKNVTNQFSAVALDERVRFLGNVRVGADVSLAELRRMYSGVVLCTGAESDKRLGIPGEDGPGVLSARQFVWWYNGHPDCASLPVDLSAVTSVAICGIGNVALDCARVLLCSPHQDPLASSDVASHALSALRGTAGRSREVHLVARRGPVQAACTAKELKEIVTWPGVRVHAPPGQMSLSHEDGVTLKKERQKRRLLEIITQAAQEPAAPADPSTPTRDLHFQFYRQPRKVVRDPVSGAVTGLEVERTALQPPTAPGRPTLAVGTGEVEVIPAQLILVSIGYRSLPVEGVAFDEQRGLIPNVAGRVLLQPSKPAGSDNPRVDPGLYVCGWIKRGPSGIIGTNAVDAEETVSSIVEDIKSGILLPPPAQQAGAEGLAALLTQRHVKVVDFAGWQRIDAEEVRAGHEAGRVRDKITSMTRMVDVAAAG